MTPTATHGAFRSLAFGIGTSEMEHVMATQTLKQGRARTMRISVNGKLAAGISAKDVVLAIIKVGHAGGTGYVVEFAGEKPSRAHHGRAHDGVQRGHRARRQSGHDCPDRTTIDYIRGHEFAPKGGPGTGHRLLADPQSDEGAPLMPKWCSTPPTSPCP